MVVSQASRVFHSCYNYGARFNIFAFVLAFFPYCLGGRRSLQRGTQPDMHSMYLVRISVTLFYVQREGSQVMMRLYREQSDF